MKRTQILLAIMIFLLVLPSVFGQDVEVKGEKDKEKGKESVTVRGIESSDVPVKVQILLTEFDGTQKVSSLPYTIYTLASSPNGHSRSLHLRLGVKVPVRSESSNQFSYQDVGTNIDCTAQQFTSGAFTLDFTIERSSVSTRGSNGEESDWKPGAASPNPEPMIRSFRDSFTLMMRDGQAMEGTSAVDPVTGHVLKVEVSLSVLN